MHRAIRRAARGDELCVTRRLLEIGLVCFLRLVQLILQLRDLLIQLVVILPLLVHGRRRRTALPHLLVLLHHLRLQRRHLQPQLLILPLKPRIHHRRRLRLGPHRQRHLLIHLLLLRLGEPHRSRGRPRAPDRGAAGLVRPLRRERGSELRGGCCAGHRGGFVRGVAARADDGGGFEGLEAGAHGFFLLDVEVAEVVAVAVAADGGGAEADAGDGAAGDGAGSAGGGALEGADDVGGEGEAVAEVELLDDLGGGDADEVGEVEVGLADGFFLAGVGDLEERELGVLGFEGAGGVVAVERAHEGELLVEVDGLFGGGAFRGLGERDFEASRPFDRVFSALACPGNALEHDVELEFCGRFDEFSRRVGELFRAVRDFRRHALHGAGRGGGGMVAAIRGGK
mmetsp:Transcript_19874/g.49337  ORF Transcript_19874/g.49337 Transcript_19874/m.49337 type:complete len:398 (+) Transcript_19874:2346-3539(+)